MDAEIQIPSYFDNGVWVRDLARESMGRRWHECLQKISGFNRTHRPELFNWCQQERQFVADTKFQQPFPKKRMVAPTKRRRHILDHMLTENIRTVHAPSEKKVMLLAKRLAVQ